METDPGTLIDFEDPDLGWPWVGVIDGVRYTMPYNVYIVLGFIFYLFIAAALQILCIKIDEKYPIQIENETAVYIWNQLYLRKSYDYYGFGFENISFEENQI